jgi:hypothetical protein
MDVRWDLGETGTEVPALPASFSEESLKQYAATNGRDAARQAVLAEYGVDIDTFLDKDGKPDWKQVARAAVKRMGGPDPGPLIDAASEEGGVNWNGVARETAGIAGFAVCTYFQVPPQVSVTVCVAAGRFLYDVNKEIAKAIYKYGSQAVEALLDLFSPGGDSAPSAYVQVVPTPEELLQLSAAWYGTFDLERAIRLSSLRTVLLLALRSTEGIQQLWKSSLGTELSFLQAFLGLVRCGLRIPIRAWDVIGVPIQGALAVDVSPNEDWAGGQRTQGYVQEWFLVGKLFKTEPTKYDDPAWYDHNTVMWGFIGNERSIGHRKFFVNSGGTYAGYAWGPTVAFVTDDGRPRLQTPRKGFWYGYEAPNGGEVIWSFYYGIFLDGIYQSTPLTDGSLNLNKLDIHQLEPQLAAQNPMDRAKLDVWYPLEIDAILSDPVGCGIFVELIQKTLNDALLIAMRDIRWAARNLELGIGKPYQGGHFTDHSPPPPPGIVAPPPPAMVAASLLPVNATVRDAMSNILDLPAPDPDSVLASTGAFPAPPPPPPPASDLTVDVAEEAPKTSSVFWPTVGLLGVAAGAWAGYRVYTKQPVIPSAITKRLK